MYSSDVKWSSNTRLEKKKSYIDNAISHSMIESNLEKYILFKNM